MQTIQGQSTAGGAGDRGHGNVLKIQVVSEDERQRFDDLLGAYHYLGETRPVGDFLRQAAVLDGQWVGLLAWGSACYALKPRDSYIGWTATQRAERQKLVVQNRRFLLLGEKGAHPNLASRILGAAVKALPEQWLAHFHYAPLLAETFTDIESFHGTCYKASGWEPLGQSQGFSRHRADFYVPHDRPKKLWVKKLRKNALDLLKAPELPEAQRQGGMSSAHGVMPLKAAQIESLYEMFFRVKDPRAKNSRFRLAPVLTIVAMALLSGYRDISQIHRFGQRLKQDQRRRLGLPRKDGKSFWQVPSYNVYYNLLRQLDITAFAQTLSAWLRAHQGTLPASLAMDGKMVRDTIGIVSLVDHENGVPQAMACISVKEGEGDRGELKMAQKLVMELPDLNDKLVTGDALHTQTATAQAIVAQGGDFLLQLKGNQKTAREAAARGMADLSPLFRRTKKRMAGSPSAKSRSVPSIP